MGSQIAFFHLRWKPLWLSGYQQIKFQSLCLPRVVPCDNVAHFRDVPSSFWFLYCGVFSLVELWFPFNSFLCPWKQWVFHSIKSKNRIWRQRKTVTNQNTAKIFSCEDAEESVKDFNVMMNLRKQKKPESCQPSVLWSPAVYEKTVHAIISNISPKVRKPKPALTS